MLTAAQAEHLALMATRSPSIHNTQPWQLVVTDTGIDVRTDRSRQLPVLDPQGRQLLMSCGSVVHHLGVAARAIALEATPHLLADPDDAELVARLDVSPGEGAATEDDIRLAEAILHRSTYRRRFLGAPLAPELLDSLRLAVEGQGAMLKEVRDDDRLILQVLVEHAEEELLHDPRYAQELAAWVWDPVVVGERVDGLPLAAVLPGENRAEEATGRRFVAPGTPTVGSPKPEHPTLVVLTTQGDAPRDWVQAGMALSALLLLAAEVDVLAQPLGQVTDVAAERARLRRNLSLVGVPQLVLRLGTAEGPRAWVTPRRPVEEVLRWARTPEDQ